MRFHLVNFNRKAAWLDRTVDMLAIVIVSLAVQFILIPSYAKCIKATLVQYRWEDDRFNGSLVDRLDGQLSNQHFPFIVHVVMRFFVQYDNAARLHGIA